MGYFRKDKTRIIAKFHRTDLVICSHSGEGKSPSPPSRGPGHIAQSVGHLVRKSEVLGSIPGLATLSFLLPLIQEGQLSVTGKSMCKKYWLIAIIGGLRLPRKSVVRLTDRPDMTLDVILDIKQNATATTNPSRGVLSDLHCMLRPACPNIYF